MKVVRIADLEGTDREVHCPRGGFVSMRALLSDDGMGFSINKTLVPAGEKQFWHYRNHLEACYCIAGRGVLTDLETGEEHEISEDVVYVLDKHDKHTFQALENTVLISVFNPPLSGAEVHDESGSYPPAASPVYGVRPIHIDDVVANDYNPNKVAPPEMKLLETSIWEDGYTQPVVTFFDESTGKYVVVDGFHRFLILRDCERIREREKGMLPVVVIHKDMSDRMASTIRHNRARGSHNVELMSVIVSELVEMGKGDRWICEHIGMSADELLRMKQVTGLASLFRNRSFSDSWEAEFEDGSDSE